MNDKHLVLLSAPGEPEVIADPQRIVTLIQSGPATVINFDNDFSVEVAGTPGEVTNRMVQAFKEARESLGIN